MINLNDIEVPSNYIAFTFVDRVNAHGLFEETHDGAIALVSQGRHTQSASNPRFVEVIKCGSSVTEVKVGDCVLVAPLRWSFAIADEDRKFHVTTIDDVLGVLEK